MTWAQRQEITLTDDWQFSRDQQTWQQVSVPHDWAISGPFDKKWDMQTVAIVQNGETQASEKTGRSGALPWIGDGYYKRKFTIPSNFSGHAELEFDGAMSQPVVTVNGQWAGSWAYGYNAFRIDITKFVKPGENLLEVSLKNMEESSRWYPGAGIYRPVKLLLTPKTHIDDWSLFVRTTTIGKDKAELEVSAKATSDEADNFVFTLLDADGREVASTGPVNSDGNAYAKFTVKEPKLWSPESPYLYKMVARLTAGSTTIDEKTVNVGIRTVRVSKEHGFQLNGVTRKIKGVCLHHDLGPLGAAVNKAALIRQIKILKEMGCDAIRTAHNMPSQMQMDVCDSLGMMVMAESFDMWIYPKCKNGYARFFREWADRDITNLVMSKRNHPSIVMWSIGNEIPEQGSEEGRQISIRLQGLCHSLDPTRPVTQGLDRVDNALWSGVAQSMDIPGLNYRLHRYQAAYDKLTHGYLLGSETASTVSSRGVYKFPVKPTDHGVYPDGQCSGYDVEWCSWSNLPDDDWRWQDDNDWVIGEFVWTGFDYLGEPTPYDGYWPSRSSYFGICDLAGLPKDRYYLYRSHWQKEGHTIHLLPHWSWGKERRGEVTPVYCYTDYDEAELFVNGKSQGRIKKVKEDKNRRLNNKAFAEEHRLDRYRLRWNDVKYEPGTLEVVVYDEKGNNCGKETVYTAGKPHHLVLDVWTQQSSSLKADGEDLAFVTVSLVDKRGTLIPDASDQLRFKVSGAGTYRAACNGDATSLEPFTEPAMRLFNGQTVVVVQSSKQPGNLTLTVQDTKRGMKQNVVIPVK
ncbi:MAG: DUF4982 domain-containing protein [Prevotella sp.]|nr:DUF4982 domain-containing protein [Prevotella sp.]